MPRSGDEVVGKVGRGVADDGGLGARVQRSDSRRPVPGEAAAVRATLCEVTDTPQAAITLTDKAAEKIGELLGGQAEGAEQALRVAVRGGGCSGFQYALAFDKPKDDDNVFEVDGVAVVVDKVSMQFVFGSEVDYVEGLQGAGLPGQQPERRRRLRLRFLFPGQRGRRATRRR